MRPKTMFTTMVSMKMIASIISQQSLICGTGFIIGQLFRKKCNRKSFWTHQYSTAVADTYGGGGGGQLPQKCQICTMQQM